MTIYLRQYLIKWFFTLNSSTFDCLLWPAALRRSSSRHTPSGSCWYNAQCCRHFKLSLLSPFFWVRGKGGGGRGSLYRRRLCSPEIKPFQFGRDLEVSYLLTHLIAGGGARSLLTEGRFDRRLVKVRNQTLRLSVSKSSELHNAKIYLRVHVKVIAHTVAWPR